MPVDLSVAEAVRAGSEHLVAGRLAKAEYVFRQVLGADPVNPHAKHGLALIALSVGRHDVALGLLNEAIATRPVESPLHNSLGETYRAMNRPSEALASYDRALLLDPAYAEAHSNRAIVLQALGRPEEAIASCDAALKVRPGFAAAWSNRGVMLEQRGRLDEALASFEQAISVAPQFLDAQANRASLLRELGRLDEALAALDRVLAVNPAMAAAHDARGSTLQQLLRIKEALDSHRKAIALKPDFALAHLHEAIALLLGGDYKDAWEKYEYRKLAHPAVAREFDQPHWSGKKNLTGRTVLLYSEQGIGDLLQFVRYVPQVASLGAKVVLEVPAAAKPLLRGIRGAPSVIAQGDRLPKFDLQCSLLSLPHAFGTTLATVPAVTPYLSVDKIAVSAWRKKLARRGTKLVGLCWKGDPVYRKDRERSIRLSDLQPLLDLPGMRFVSLQKDLSEEELALVAKRDNFGHPGKDFKDTAELVAALDLVITVDTAWAHWAGAIGKPVWVMLAHYPHWCWLLERQDSPWYPTARLFRQEKAGDWAKPLALVKRGLAAFGRRA